MSLISRSVLRRLFNTTYNNIELTFARENPLGKTGIGALLIPGIDDEELEGLGH